jgi:hypothetical protein
MRFLAVCNFYTENSLKGVLQSVQKLGAVEFACLNVKFDSLIAES